MKKVPCQTCGVIRIINGHSSAKQYQKNRPNCNPCSNKLIWLNPKTRIKLMDGAKKRSMNKESGQAISKSVTALWKNNEYRMKQLDARSTDEFKKKRSAENNCKWKGDSVGYSALHDWVERKLGKPTKCVGCDTDGLRRHSINWANKSGKYKRDVKDWLRLCVKCHRAHDKGVLS